MLVDNTVDGDSRVQKQARSAAELGWNVILLGRSPSKTRQVRWLGEAKVILLPVPTPLARRRLEFRRAPFRFPLAYPAGPLADHRLQEVRARRAELDTRRAAARLGPAAGSRDALARALLPASTAVARVERRWVALRASKTRLFHQRRRSMTAPLDRATTRFWQQVMGARSWRRLDPGLWDYEVAFGPHIDRLKPDIVHANDFRMLGVGARAVIRGRGCGRDPKLVWDAHEYLPGIKPWSDHPRWHVAQIAHEREYAPVADAVTTVSSDLSRLLRRDHGLAVEPAVVLNAPYAQRVDQVRTAPGLREMCGLSQDIALVVYSGVAASQRGLDTMIEAMPLLGDVHVALVVGRPDSVYVRSLVSRAAELGAADRLHVHAYVPAEEVTSFLASADIGVIPVHHWPNHEIALITKFFEYSHAHLPIVVSDVRTMSATVRATGQGESFRAEDVDDYVRAVRAVLREPDRYREAYKAPGLLEGWTWEKQAEVLDQVYARLADRR